jgi:tetratricopeptide (TPR) repeat protein
MSERHPDPETLARYLRGELPPEEGEEVERHLSGCVSCQRAAAGPAGEGLEGVGKWRGHLFGYEAAFDRAARQASERLSRLFEEVSGASGLAEELLAAPEHRRRQLIRSEPRFHALKLCELLEDRSREAWFNDPARAVELARLAVAIAIRLDPEHYGSRIVEDARAHAWAYLGNSYRIASDLRRAEEALRTAREHHRRGDEDAFTEAQILSFTARLRWVEGKIAGDLDRYADAEAALRETRDAFVERGIGFDAALVSLDLAALYARQGRAEEVKRLASEMVPIFESRDVHREALAALLLFKEAALAERVTLSLLDQIVSYLERARLDPELRFRDPS